MSAWFNRGIELKRERQWREAALAFRRAASLEPTDFEAVQKLVETVAVAVEEDAASPMQGATPPGPRPATDRRAFSIVCCSIDPAREASMRANYTAALEGREHEFIVIHDARSMAEGYTRGLAQARHPLVVFTHDDVELISEHPFDALDFALASHDVVGLVGSRRVAGPGVTWAGHPHLHGWIAYPSTRHPGRWDTTLFSTDCGLLGGMQALDGVFIAARREAALAIGFDAATCDGFHFYDLDFTYRAHRAGLSLAVATDVVAVHASEGRFDDSWRACVPRFQAKFPDLDAPAGPFHAYGAPLSSKRRVLAFYEALRGLGGTP